MNFFLHNYRTMPRFCFDENATGSGGSVSASTGTDGGASSTPAAPASPSATPGGSTDSSSVSAVPAAPDGYESSSDPFAGMDDDFDSLDLGAETNPSPDPNTPAAPVAPVVPAPAPAPAAPVQEPPAAAVVPPTAGNDPASTRSPLEQAIDGFKTNEKELASWAAQNLFKLSPEEADALTTNAEEAIPLLMGKLYTQVLAASGNLIRNFVPAMIDTRVETTSVAKTRSTEALNEFYAANSHLNAKDHQKVVDKYAKVFRAANPAASRQEAIRAVGIMASAELGLSPGARAPQAPRPQPFAPARPGGRQPTTNVPGESTPWDGLDQDFDVE